MTKQFVKVANKSDIASGSTMVATVGAEQVVICNVDSNFYAVGDICSHDGAPLDQGELVGNEIECPRHGARFDVRNGKAMCLPATVAIPTHDLEIRGEEIWVSE